MFSTSPTRCQSVLWVNADDTSVAKANIMNDASRLEPFRILSHHRG